MDKISHKYKYSVLRYVPDFTTDEFMNAGIIMYCLDDNSIKAKLIDNTARLECFDPEGDHAFFLELAQDIIEELQKNVARIRKDGENMYMQDLIDKTFRTMTTPESGMISFSGIKGGLTDNIDKEFEEIYHEYVGSKMKKKERRGPRGNLAVTKVYEMIDRIKNRLKKMPEQRPFDYPLAEGKYTCEVSFNDTDNVNLKVLSLRTKKSFTYEMQNILSAVTVLSDLKQQHKKHVFGGLIYFPPQYDKRLQIVEFDRLEEIYTRIFWKSG